MGIIVSHSFTGTNGQNLSGQAGEIGGSWSKHPHVNYGSDFLFSNGRIYGTDTTAYSPSSSPSSPDYSAEADFFLNSAISQNISVAIRMHATEDTMYVGQLVNGTSWRVRKIIATVQTTLGLTSTNQLPTTGTSKRGKLVGIGDQIYFYVEDVLEIGPITDNSITAIGKPGVRNAGVAISSTGIHLDNFLAADITQDPNLGSIAVPQFLID